MALTGLTNLQPLHIKTVGIGTFDNTVSVGGTLTYEDVTNVDAIGIITARAGLNVSGGTGTFAGDVSIADKIIHTGDTNTAIRFPAADTLSVETGGSERIRIDSAGRVGLGTIAPSSFHANADNFVIMSDNAPVGMTLMTTNGGLDSTIAFADGTSGGTELQGAIIYQHNGDAMRFLVNQSERLRITAQNAIGLGGANYGSSGQVLTSQGSGAGAIWSTISTDLVSDTSPQLGGNLDTNSHEISLDTSHAVNFGDSNELKVFYHSGNGQIDFNGTTSLQLKTPANKYFQVLNRDNGNNIIQAQAGGVVQLYHNGVKKFEVTGAGVEITGNAEFANNNKAIFGTGNDAAIYHNDTDFVIDAQESGATRNIYIDAGTVSEGGIFLRSAAGDTMFKALTDSSCFLYFDNSLKFRTMTDHCEIRGHLLPDVNNTDDIGSSSKRFRNIYTNDLNLSNKGSTNSVDNTWGDYTIQEGESDLFLINNRNGKKYKFNLTEVS